MNYQERFNNLKNVAKEHKIKRAEEKEEKQIT